MHVCFDYLYICVPHIHGALEARSGHGIPKNWSYRGCEHHGGAGK